MPNYTDIPACMQVIGAVYNNPSLLDNEKYKFNDKVKLEIVHGYIENKRQREKEEVKNTNSPINTLLNRDYIIEILN